MKTSPRSRIGASHFRRAHRRLVIGFLSLQLLAANVVSQDTDAARNLRLGEASELPEGIRMGFGIYWKEDDKPFANVFWRTDWNLADISGKDRGITVVLRELGGVALGRNKLGDANRFGVTEILVENEGKRVPIADSDDGRLLLISPRTLSFSERILKPKRRTLLEIRCNETGFIEYVRYAGKKVPTFGDRKKSGPYFQIHSSGTLLERAVAVELRHIESVPIK